MLDNLTASATASYSLTLDSVAFVPESANHLLVSLNGHIQKANSSYTVSSSTLTFSQALTSSDSIDFVLALGNVLDIGTPSDATVTNAKTNFVSTSSAAGLDIKGDGTTDGTLRLLCSQGTHGVKIASPAHSAGQSYTLTLPTGNVTADKFLKVASITGSGTTAVGQLSFADGGGSLTPYFYAYRNASLSISHATFTTIVYDVEDHDTGSGFNTSTGQYTVPEAGKYYFHYAIRSTANADTNSVRIFTKGERTGSASTTWGNGALDFRANYGRAGTVVGSTIMTCAANDVVYTQIYHQTVNSGNVDIEYGTTRSTYFMGFKIAD
jgi:hypothetical protein